MTKLVTVSVPGKIHLAGEHAVVYGKPAILTAVSKRLTVTIAKNHKAIKQCNHITVSSLRKTDKYFDHIVSLVEKKYSVKIPKSYISISSDIPKRAGMGSSAAFAAATIGALTSFLKKPWNVSTINLLTYKAEQYIHGNPSGGDNTVVCFGGLLWFRREFEFLKTFWSLPIKIPKSFAAFVIVDTGRVESTKKMVERVNSKFKAQSSKLETMFNKTEQYTKSMLQAIHDEDEAVMRKAITACEKSLEKLGVVSSIAKKFIRDVEKKGGVAKVSGAGGVKKGSGIVLCQHNDPKVVLDLAEKHGFDAFCVELGEMGVKVEKAVD